MINNEIENKINVLLVEDDEEDYILTEGYFKDIPHQNYTISWVKNYDEAVKYLKNNSYDVLLVDYYLGEHNGFEVLRYSVKNHIDLPVIVLTGANDTDIDIKAMNEGASDYLVKTKLEPFRLERVIRYAIGQKKAEYDIRQLNIELEKKVTERTKQLEEINKKLKKSLKQKEVLLREIHHRVKNNLQIISSLISLQALSNNDPVIKGMFQESQNRIKSIAYIHQKLYQSENVDEVDFSSYINTITENLLNTYGVDDGKITLIKKCDEVFMPLDLAIPCGLIFTEIFTNAIKYAFPGSKKGTILIELQQIGEKYQLVISDDGVGLPEDINLENSSSLGMNLINMLTHQLNGKLDIDRDKGTKFSIIFPK